MRIQTNTIYHSAEYRTQEMNSNIGPRNEPITLWKYRGSYMTASQSQYQIDLAPSLTIFYVFIKIKAHVNLVFIQTILQIECIALIFFQYKHTRYLSKSICCYCTGPPKRYFSGTWCDSNITANFIIFITHLPTVSMWWWPIQPPIGRLNGLNTK